jgi:hypothetical protein
MSLQRTFSSFPGGWAGVALLVLRLFVGTCVITEALLIGASSHPVVSITARALAALLGLALSLGFLTPIAGALLAAMSAAFLLSGHAGILFLFDSRIALLEFALISAALTILGPGATSFDARLFGLREVTIRERDRPDDLVS